MAKHWLLAKQTVCHRKKEISIALCKGGFYQRDLKEKVVIFSNPQEYQ